MSIHKIAAGPWGCGDFDELAIFLGAGDDTNTGGRNRYHCYYVIYTDGTYYYAENGTTGELDYGGPSDEGTATGTNAASVIQAAITNLTTGGKIFIKHGTYTITATITIPNNSIIIEGEYAPQTNVTNVDMSTRLHLGANVDMFQIYGSAVTPAASRRRAIVFRNLLLDGADRSNLSLIDSRWADAVVFEHVMFDSCDNAIDATVCWDWRLTDCIFNDVGSAALDAITIRNSDAGNSNCWQFRGCRFEAHSGNAVQFVSTGAGGRNNIFNFTDCKFENSALINFYAIGGFVTDVRITDCQFVRWGGGTAYAVQFENNSERNIVKGCWFLENRQDILFGTGTAHYNEATDNVFSTASGANNIEVNGNYNHIFNNRLAAGVTTLVVINGGTGNEIRNNEGYNPQAAATPAVGASPVTFGPYNYPMMIGVVGGTITSVTIRAQATGQAGAGTFAYYSLYPGDTCIIVYTVVPTVYTYPQ